jgi:hypothetical protein
MEERRSNVDALRKMRVSRAASTVLWLGERKGYEYIRVVPRSLPRSLPRSFCLAHAPMEHRKGGYHDPMEHRKGGYHDQMERHIPRVLTYPTHPDSILRILTVSCPATPTEMSPKRRSSGLETNAASPDGWRGGRECPVRSRPPPRELSPTPRCGTCMFEKCFGKKVFWKKSVLEKKCFGKKVGTSVTKVLVEHEKRTVLPPSRGTW